ncbi:MAG: hypothetical protein Q7S41_01360 [Candidatus Limnocylindria bacterium]|nr:hypothetical protein [Candidatus Limnocylindria bacterium]
MKVSTRIGILIIVAGLVVSCGGATAEPASSAAAAAAAPTATAAQSAAPQAPAAAKTLIVVADTTSGSIGTTDEEKAAFSCVQKNRFPQGEPIVWRVKIYSTTSGKPMDDKELKSVVMTLPDGKTQDLKFGPHPKGKTDDYFWTTSFKIPADYPTGAFKYKLVATSPEGTAGTYDQFNVASSLLQVIKVGTR